MLAQFLFQFPNNYIYDHFRTEAGESNALWPKKYWFCTTSERLLVLDSWDSEGQHDVCFSKCLMARCLTFVWAEALWKIWTINIWKTLSGLGDLDYLPSLMILWLWQCNQWAIKCLEHTNQNFQVVSYWWHNLYLPYSSGLWMDP